MTANTVASVGTGTLPITGPGAYSSVTVTDASVVTSDIITLTLTNNIEDYTDDGYGTYDAYVSSVAGGTFVVKCNKRQLPKALTFNYVAIQTA